LLRAISAGDVRTGYVWAGLPNNLIHGTTSDASQTDNVKVDATQMEIGDLDERDMEAEMRGKMSGLGKSGVAGIVEGLESVDIFEGGRGRASTSRRKTSRTSSKSPRKMSPRKSSPEKQSRRLEPYPS